MKAGTRNIIRNALDKQVVFQRDAKRHIQKPTKGWLKAVRQAIGMTQSAVAERAGLSRQAYAQLEKAEEKHRITLRYLERAAEGMDCDLVYFIVPKDTIAHTYAELAGIHDPAFAEISKTRHTMALEGQTVERPGEPKP